MKAKFYGTRGSIPISNPESVRYGGNTTCVRVMSDCLPKGMALVIDAGSGFVPLTYDLLREGGIEEVLVLFSHYHHDHTQGLLLSPLAFMKNVKLRLAGPVEGGVGPKEMMEEVMRPPYFPVHFREVSSHITCKGFEFPKTLVGIFHPQGGYKLILIDEYERLVGSGQYLPIGKGKYPASECLVVSMYNSNHPERTISYRFEEKPTGKTFVFLTDHQNEDGTPVSMQRHLKDVDLLVMDSQYSRKMYDERTAGFGHGTPDYCIGIAEKVGAKKLGLTHHDPNSKDADIDAILAEAQAKSNGGAVEVFACADYLTIEV